MEIGTITTLASTRGGKSAQAVGQIAKAAVAEAKTAGVSVPKNAQGMAASAIAQGADPGSVFAALIVPEPVSETGIETSTADDPPNNAETPTTLADEGYGSATGILNAGLESGAETALSLLEDAL